MLRYVNNFLNGTNMSNPLIVTLKIDDSAFEFFNRQRTKYFPEKLNYLDAHLTLFHHLPDIETIKNELLEIANNQKKIDIKVTDLMKLGRGVAYKLESNELLKLHLNLQKKFEEFLIPQDKQKLRPHITIQNKVTPDQASTLFEFLKKDFDTFNIEGVGFSIWEYLGGPWEKIEDYYFVEN